MFKRLGVFGLMLAAAGTSLIQPVAAFGQNRFDRGNGYAYYDRGDRNHYRDDRDWDRDRRGYGWQEREWRERARREHEWRERQRWQNRSDRYYSAPGYYNSPYYGRPY